MRTCIQKMRFYIIILQKRKHNSDMPAHAKHFATLEPPIGRSSESATVHLISSAPTERRYRSIYDRQPNWPALFLAEIIAA